MECVLFRPARPAALWVGGLLIAWMMVFSMAANAFADPASPPETVTADRVAAESRPALAPSSQPTSQAADDTPAHKRLETALKAYGQRQYLQARGPLTRLLLTANLTDADEAQAIEALSDIAKHTLLAGETLKGDPYAQEIAVERGDTPMKIVRREKLAIDGESLLDINGIDDARRLKIDQKLKVLRGTVHAVVRKEAFTIDLFLRLDGQEPAFLKRLRVGLGKNDGTPEGLFRVRDKTTHATWTPPASSGRPAKAIKFGEPGYPFGSEGRWIALEGIDEKTRGRTGYGVHGTDKPESIGKTESLGCVRMGDDDIKFVYRMMSPGQSTVEIRP